MLDLGLKERPLIEAKFNPWLPEQEKILEGLYYKGYIPEVMAEYIPKSASAIRAKTERLIKEGRLDKDRNRPVPAKEHGGISYKLVLPPDKWPRIEHFLASLSTYAVLAKEAGKKLDVSVFLTEYEKIDHNEDVAAG